MIAVERLGECDAGARRQRMIVAHHEHQRVTPIVRDVEIMRVRVAGADAEIGEAVVDEYPDEDTLGPEASAVEREHLRLLERLIDGLDPEKRAVVVLLAFEHKSTAEIASILALKPKTVESRLRAAREQIQAALDCHKVRDTWRIK